MKTFPWLVGVVMLLAPALAQKAPTFTRPGTMIVVNQVGDAVAVAGGQEKPLKVDERLRGETVFRTERKSTVTVEFENGSTMKLGSESEVVVDEFWQQPHLAGGKVAEMKEEPSPSRTTLRLARGDVTLNVKPLLTARGSSFTLELAAGTLRIKQGALLARVQMTELGIGLCTLELRDGAAEFERVGGATAALPVGRRLVLAVEIDRQSGAVKVSDAPRP